MNRCGELLSGYAGLMLFIAEMGVFGDWMGELDGGIG